MACTWININDTTNKVWNAKIFYEKKNDAGQYAEIACYTFCWNGSFKASITNL